MISMDGIASMARMILPAGSPWLQRIEQAREMAGKFTHDRNGVAQLMQSMGKGQEDIRRAMQMLDNSKVSGLLNRISPNLTNTLRQAGNELLSSSANTPQQVESPTDALRKRLERL